jgi:hypothetical protein
MNNYVSVPFKGGYYMCVEGSKRADALRRANRAWVMGYDDLADDLLGEAMEMPGCAFDDRQAVSRATATVTGLGAESAIDFDELRRMHELN